MRSTKAAAGAIATLAIMATAVPGAVAKSGDITVAGTCTAHSASKLKAGPRISDGVIAVEFQVDSNVVGQAWNWRLSDNTLLVAKGTKTTLAPSGSFTVDRRIPDRAGSDKIVARATNPATGESCVARVTI